MKNILTNKRYVKDIEKILKKYKFKELNSKTILVTGGLGLIGSAIVDLLYIANKKLKLNNKILVGARNKDQFESRYNLASNVEFVYYDALKPIQFPENIDYVISCASIANPKMYVNSPVETLMTCIDGTRNLLEFCRKNKPKRFLYVSSSEVYGVKKEDKSFHESMYGSFDLDNIRSSYAIGKVSSELLCRSYIKEYGLDCIVVRPGHIFGPTASMKDKRVSSEFAFLAARGESLTLKSLGLQKRSYCYCLDCAAAIILALIKGVNGESYNIGHEEVTSIREMASYIAKAGGVDLVVSEPTQEELESFNPMENSTLNNEKIRQIGYEDCFSVEESFDHTVQILKEIIE